MEAPMIECHITTIKYYQQYLGCLQLSVKGETKRKLPALIYLLLQVYWDNKKLFIKHFAD